MPFAASSREDTEKKRDPSVLLWTRTAEAAALTRTFHTTRQIACTWLMAYLSMMMMIRIIIIMIIILYCWHNGTFNFAQLSNFLVQPNILFNILYLLLKQVRGRLSWKKKVVKESWVEHETGESWIVDTTASERRQFNCWCWRAGVGVWPGRERKYDLLMRCRETPELSEEEQQNGILPVLPHPLSIHFIFIYLGHHSSTCRHFLQCRTWLGHWQNLIIIQSWCVV